MLRDADYPFFIRIVAFIDFLLGLFFLLIAIGSIFVGILDRLYKIEGWFFIGFLVLIRMVFLYSGDGLWYLHLRAWILVLLFHLICLIICILNWHTIIKSIQLGNYLEFLFLTINLILIFFFIKAKKIFIH